MHARLRSPVVMLFLAATSCAHGTRGGDVERLPAGALPVRVNVTNRFNLSMEVYVIAGGTTQRLGLVSSGLDRTFVIPQILIGNGPIELSAQPSGTGPVVRSGRLLISAGDVVDFLITSSLFDTRATIR